MAVVGFTEGNIGQWRYLDRDIVGGRGLSVEPFESQTNRGQKLQKWTWHDGHQEYERLVAANVAETAPASDPGVSSTQQFPADGGAGWRGRAGWSWYPEGGVSNELMFPKGAEIREIRDMNGDWFFGSYMDKAALFPAPYVTLGQAQQDQQGSS